MNAFDSLLDRIKKLFLAGKFQEIIQKRAEIERIEPYAPKHNLLLLEALFEIGRYWQALDKLHEIQPHVKKLESQIHFNIMQIKTLTRLGKITESSVIAEKIRMHLHNSDIPIKLRIHQFYALGFLDTFRGDLTSATQYLNQGLDLISVQNFDQEIRTYKARTLANLSFVLFYRGEFDKAVSLAQDALDIAKKIDHRPLIAHIYVTLGNGLVEMKRISEAVDAFENALVLSIEDDYTLGIAASRGNLSQIFRDLGELELASEHVEEALVLDTRHRNYRNMAKGYEVKGQISMARGELDKALTNHLKELEIKETLGNPIDTGAACQHIGLVQYYLGDLHLAGKYMERSAELLHNHKLYLSNTYFILIRIYLDWDNLDQARHYLEKLQTIDDGEYRLMGLRSELAQALVLRKDNRPSRIFKAFSILEKIVKEEVIDHELSILARYRLCDLQLAELEFCDDDMTGELLDEIKANLDKLLEIAEINHSNSVLVRALLLQSKVSLIDDPYRAKEQVNIASQLAEKYSINYLNSSIGLQKKLVDDEIQQWERDGGENRSIKRQVKRLQLDKYAEMLSRQREETSMFLHDINNLLQINMNYANILKYDEGISQNSMEYVNSIKETGLHIKNLVDSLKQIISLDTRDYSISYNSLNVHALLERLVEVYQPEARKKQVNFELKKDPEEQEIRSSEDLVKRILDNLFSNALKYCPNGSKVGITSEIGANNWIMSITNGGEPIPVEDQKHIFNKFYRMQIHQEDRDKRGSGLGLAFCKTAVEALGGHIQVISPLDGKEEGVCFQVSIPKREK